MRGFVLALALAACGGPPSPVVAPVAPNVASEFPKDEERVLQILAAADLRVAQRGITPDEKELSTAAMGAILNEDTGAQIEAGRADLFSFGLRERALDDASKILAEYDPKKGLEIERLARLVEEERGRLAQERNLPVGASTLFPGLAATWQATVIPAEAERMDTHLAKRFDDVAQAVGGDLSPEERDGLEQSLDPIERKMTDAYVKSEAALVRLRLKLGQAPVVVRAQANTRAFESVRVTDPAPVEQRLTELEQRLRALHAERVTAEAHGNKSGPVNFGGSSGCKLGGSDASRLGKLEAPPERQDVCSIVATFAPLAPMELGATTIEAFHDHVVVALWALAIARGDAPAVAINRQRPLEPPRAEAALTRIAALRPAQALATALAIEWLMKEGPTNLMKRAAAWEMFGDAPVDIAIREIKMP